MRNPRIAGFLYCTLLTVFSSSCSEDPDTIVNSSQRKNTFTYQMTVDGGRIRQMYLILDNSYFSLYGKDSVLMSSGDFGTKINYERNGDLSLLDQIFTPLYQQYYWMYLPVTSQRDTNGKLADVVVDDTLPSSSYNHQVITFSSTYIGTEDITVGSEIFKCSKTNYVLMDSTYYAPHNKSLAPGNFWTKTETVFWYSDKLRFFPKYITTSTHKSASDTVPTVQLKTYVLQEYHLQ